MDTVERARRYLAKLPPAVSGSGGHDATFKAASILVNGFALDVATAQGLLTEWNLSHCTPPWTDKELLHKLKSAEKKSSDRGHLLARSIIKTEIFPSPSAVIDAPRWPTLNMTQLSKIVNDGATLSELFERSPVVNDAAEPPDYYLQELFAPGSLLCVGKSINRAVTVPMEKTQGKLGGYQFIVPNPMTSRKGKNLEGRASSRCLDNTGDRRFLVIECDFEQVDKKGVRRPEAELFEQGHSVDDMCAAVLLHLAQFAPLVMAVRSGGKSVHGWFPTQGHTDAQLEAFMRYAVTVGADKATWCPCQFVRLPNGRRANGKRQQTIYFNPDLLKTRCPI